MSRDLAVIIIIIIINCASAEQSKHNVSITPLALLHKCQWSVVAIGHAKVMKSRQIGRGFQNLQSDELQLLCPVRWGVT